MQGVGEGVEVAAGRRSQDLPASVLCLSLTWVLSPALDILPSPAPATKQVPSGCFFAFWFFLIYLFLAASDLHCCMRAFSSCSERGLLFVAVRRLIAVASLVAEHGL